VEEGGDEGLVGGLKVRGEGGAYGIYLHSAT
jgi:hypothetical protein